MQGTGGVVYRRRRSGVEKEDEDEDEGVERCHGL